KNRIPVDLEEIPDHVRQATIAIEDKNFYSHPGFSVWGMVRAMFNTLIKRRLEGGSTLTQQLVKNVLLTRERTINRKIKEFILALELERRYGKDEILELYLNEAPYGGTFWGIASAAQGYFGKDVGELTLAEAAVLAGLPQRPTYYSPIIGKERAYIGRAKDVLRRMREDDYITKEEELKATKQVENMKIKKSNLAIRAPHFVFYVRKLISEQFGEKILDQGIEITTTLDLDLQEQAQKIVFDEIEKTKALKATNGSVIVLDNKTGQILSMVGSYDYTDEDYGRFNTTTALRQPGSAIKPITYATAFTQGYTPATLVMDVPTEFPDQGDKNYNPVNYDGKFRGPIQLRFALGNSINVPAVKVLALVGIRNFLTQASSMGLETLVPTDANLKRFGLSLTLGGGETRLIELTSAYSVFGRGGTRIDPIAILEIKDHKGKSLFKAKKTTEKRVLSKEVSFLISHILSDNVARALAFGTNSKLVVPGKTVAVKTGTTNDKRDNWAVGFTRSVTVGSWVGNNDNS
ncbi:MAG: transglycosylase domain-containing protein, partial [Candidatus Paceibacterota bacterium]